MQGIIDCKADLLIVLNDEIILFFIMNERRLILLADSTSIAKVELHLTLYNDERYRIMVYLFLFIAVTPNYLLQNQFIIYL